MIEPKLKVIRFDNEDVIATSGVPGFAPTAGGSTYYTSTIKEWNQAYSDGKVGYDVNSTDVLLLMTFSDAETVNSMVQSHTRRRPRETESTASGMVAQCTESGA